jgi:regulator of replication initiation timing
MLKHLESKIDDDLQMTDLKNKVQDLTNENNELKMSLNESQTTLSLAKCEISNLKALNDERAIEQLVDIFFNRILL